MERFGDLGYRRLQFRMAISSAIDRIKWDKQRAVLELFVSEWLDLEAEPNLTKLAAAASIPQSSFHELLGRALFSLRDELAQDPRILEWLGTRNLDD